MAKIASNWKDLVDRMLKPGSVSRLFYNLSTLRTQNTFFVVQCRFIASAGPTRKVSGIDDFKVPRFAVKGDDFSMSNIVGDGVDTIDEPAKFKVPENGWYRRPLPSALVAFSSREGKKRFADSLKNGTLEAYFPLSEQFLTQSEPAYCGLGTLAMVLNTMAIDPQRIWKSPWRWYSEELLMCCRGPKHTKVKGINLDEFVCLARCNGATADLHRADRSSVDELRKAIISASKNPSQILVISYDRKGLGQTGSGHFSPIAGYHAASDSALVMDVARFKYPPYWASINEIWDAMSKYTDQDTGKPRGFLVLASAPAGTQHLACNRPSMQYWQEIGRLMYPTFKHMTETTCVCGDIDLNVVCDSAMIMQLLDRYFSRIPMEVIRLVEAFCDKAGKSAFVGMSRNTKAYSLVDKIVSSWPEEGESPLGDQKGPKAGLASLPIDPLDVHRWRIKSRPHYREVLTLLLYATAPAVFENCRNEKLRDHVNDVCDLVGEADEFRNEMVVIRPSLRRHVDELSDSE